MRKVLRLAGRLRPAERTCRRCGRAMAPVGFFMAERLGLPADEKQRRRLAGRTLSAIGLRTGDVFSLRADRGPEVHYELARNGGSG